MALVQKIFPLLMFDGEPHFELSPGISRFVTCKSRWGSTAAETSWSPAAAGRAIAAGLQDKWASPG